MAKQKAYEVEVTYYVRAKNKVDAERMVELLAQYGYVETACSSPPDFDAIFQDAPKRLKDKK